MNNNSMKKDLRFKLAKLLSVIISVLFLFAVIAIIVPDKNLIYTASGATLYVGGSGSGNYTYIQEAIDAAKPGDTVYVYNKTYYECIQINKSINLTGENILGRRPIIDGGENFHVVYVNNVKFYFNMRGFEVRNSSLKGAYSGIYINLSSNINIINNKIHDCVDGIMIDSSSFINIHGNEIYNNYNDGIESQYSSNNNFTNNTFHDNSENGLFFSGNPYYNNKIIGNIIYNSGNDGIHLEIWGGPPPWHWNNWVINNTVYNFGASGIYIGGGHYSYIIGNKVYNITTAPMNPRGNIHLNSCNDTSVIGNIVHNGMNGILLDLFIFGYPPLNNTIKNNTIYNNENGIGLSRAVNNTFINNTIFDNNYNIHMFFPILTGHGAKGSNFINCSLSNASINVYMERKSWDNTFINCSLLNVNFYNVYLNNSYDNNFINCSLSNTSFYNVYLNNSYDNNFINCSLSNANFNVYLDQQSWGDNFINSSLSNADVYDFYLREDSHAISLNTTFDGAKVWLEDPTSTLTVKNYLHIWVLNASIDPILGADIEVTDNGIPIYQTPGFGGSDPQTGSDGFVHWVVVTDRIYRGSSKATENITNAEVSYLPKMFIDNPREVNMYSSHVEIFIEEGGVLLPDLILSKDDITFNPSSPVKDKTLVTIGAMIHNIGLKEGKNVVVRFYDGVPSPANLIGEVQIPSIPALGGVGWAEIEWTATPVGMHNIYVVVDPDNIIVESDEANNIANKIIDVGIPLYKGWNLISIPFIQSDTNLGSVLSSITGAYDAVQWYNVSDTFDQWKHYQILKPSNLNDLDNIDHKMGFWVHIIQQGETIFLCNGTQPLVNQTIPLYPGWNQVGYLSLTSYNRTKGLNNLTFSTYVDAIWTYNATTQKWKELGPLDYFEIGRGYWIHSKVKCDWEVPL